MTGILLSYHSPLKSARLTTTATKLVTVPDESLTEYSEAANHDETNSTTAADYVASLWLSFVQQHVNTLDFI